MEASMRPLTISLALALSAAAGPLAVAQTSRAASAPEMKLWRTPWEGARPRDPFADQKGHVWFVGQEGNFVGRLDPKTGEFKRYEVESGTHPHTLVVDAKGQVWFTGNQNGRIVRLDPATGKLTNFMMPDSKVRDPHTMTFDGNGDAWFTAQGAAVVGKLTTSTGKIRLWKMESGSRPYGIVVDSKNRPWFDLFGTNKIGTIDPSSGEFKAYTLPNDRARPRRIAVTKDDVIWYGDFTRGFLGRLDPKTGRIEEYALPSGPGSLPYAMTSDDRGRIWLAETGPQPNRLVAFDPAQRKFTENIVIASDKANTIRHMTFDKASRQIWFGGDADMIGRVAVAPQPLVP
jgi:virginiamycin B lyase